MPFTTLLSAAGELSSVVFPDVGGRQQVVYYRGSFTGPSGTREQLRGRVEGSVKRRFCVVDYPREPP
jgi:hypothetical protein